jgi:ribosomal-protein-alanine N-acetyltransferase
MKNIEIKSERLRLRFVNEIDLEDIHLLHSLKEVDRFNTSGIPKNKDETKSLVNDWIIENNKEKAQRFTFVIEMTDKSQLIGLIGINLGKEKYRNAEVWFKLHPKCWNQGFATEALRELLDFGFTNLKLHRIEAGCAIENAGCIRVLEKAGMLRESHTRKLLPLQSGWSDNYGYAKLETD